MIIFESILSIIFIISFGFTIYFIFIKRELERNFCIEKYVSKSIKELNKVTNKIVIFMSISMVSLFTFIFIKFVY